MSEENGLPKGWAEASVDDLSHVVRGISFPTNAKHPTPHKGDIACLRTANVQAEVEWDDLWYVPETYVGREEQFVQEDDILISTANSYELVGKVARVRRVPMRSSLGAFIALMRCREVVTPAFLHHQMCSLEVSTRLRSMASTTTNISNISTGKLRELGLRIAPLPEQHRIVEKIEELFSDLDAGVASLERAKANLKRYRASVLKSAVEGRLTGQAPFPHKRFEELIDGLSQGWSPKCELTREPDENEWAIIKTTAVQSLAYSDREAKPLPDSLEPRPHLEICEGDFLMTRKGPRQRAGVACLVRHTRPRLMVCDTVYRFRCRPEIVSPAYLEIALNTPVVIEAIDRLKSGINDSGVSLTHNKLYAVPIPLPPLAEQEQIVALVEERLSQIDSAEKTIDAELIRSKRLRQSILKRAFEGKLVPQDPKDEPASVLLERIKASREAEQPRKKAKKATKVKAK